MKYVTKKEKKINELADERQRELYKKMPSGHFLSNQENMHHVLLWNTFFGEIYIDLQKTF